jgi:hypothetical protein
MDSLQFHLGPPCRTLLRPVGGPTLKRPYTNFWGSLPTGQAACACLLPLWTPHAVRLCSFARPDVIEGVTDPDVETSSCRVLVTFGGDDRT